MSTATAPADTTDHTPYTFEEKKKRIFAIFAASSGNLVEWFDFYVYAFCAIYFAPAFFPKSDPTVQLLNTAGVFAAGFLMRPVGGWLFGRLADRKGRKTSMVVSVTMMCAGSLIIACLPTYAQIGAAAPALLLAVLVVVLLQQALDDAELKRWGWRIPFVLGAVAAVVALALRRTLTETASKQHRATQGAGTLRHLFAHHKRAFFVVLGYTAGGSLVFYTFTTYMQKYLVNSAGMSIKTASNVMTACLFLYMCMQPLFGALSDRIGRRNNMLLFGALGALMTVPVMSQLQQVGSPLVAGVLITLALAVVSFYTSISGVVKAEMFPPEVRALGVGLSYAVGNAIFGGSAEYVALGLKSLGHESYFYWYVTGMLAITFLVSLMLPKQASYLHHDK